LGLGISRDFVLSDGALINTKYFADRNIAMSSIGEFLDRPPTLGAFNFDDYFENPECGL
jgi:hypothetical protein